MFRGIFIWAGAALVRFHWALVLFGIFLIYTGVRLAFSGGETVDPGQSPVMRWLRHWMPVTANWTDGSSSRASTACSTRLRCWWCSSYSRPPIVFAVDSVPAVFGVTREPLIVFTSNVFAILGLRSLYFLLAGAMGRFHALQYGLAVVLVFVGLKMAWLDSLFGGRFPIGVSLAIICGVLAVSVGLSLLFPGGLPRLRARPVMGTVCLVLALLSALAALGPVREWARPERADSMDGQWFALSAAACAIGGGLLLLLRPSTSSSKPERRSRRPEGLP